MIRHPDCVRDLSCTLALALWRSTDTVLSAQTLCSLCMTCLGLGMMYSLSTVPCATMLCRQNTLCVCVLVCAHVLCLRLLPSPCMVCVFTQCSDWLYPDWPHHEDSEPNPTLALSARSELPPSSLIQTNTRTNPHTPTHTHLEHHLSNSSVLCSHI